MRLIDVLLDRVRYSKKVIKSCSKEYCPICASIISHKADICPHCGHPIRRESFERDDSKAGINNFVSLNAAYPSILGVFFILLLLLPIVILLFILFIKQPVNFQQPLEFIKLLDTNHILFILYILLFFSVWIVYFNSRKKFIGNGDKEKEDKTLFKIKSLRRLLSESSAHWKSSNSESFITGLEDSFRRKASTSMQVLAILIAVTALLMKTVSSMLDSSSTFSVFQLLMLYLSGFSSLISFTCFVISVDALDVVFNKFFTSQDRHSIVPHYYDLTINPRYYGLVSLMLGVVFLAAFYNPLSGCLAIGVILFVGYFHWFPEIQPYTNQKIEVTITRLSERRFLWLIVLLPIILFINDAFR